MESRSHPLGGHKSQWGPWVASADALVTLGTKATRLAIMLAVLGMTVWEAFGH
jgi:hypothetical protein